MGGLKVFPVEVEEAIAALPGVLDCAVFGEAHALTGGGGGAGAAGHGRVGGGVQAAHAAGAPGAGRSRSVKVALADGELVSDRFKKVRR
ncbi:MAG: hypothetical protein R3F60_29220 [bacterium]